MLPVFGRRYRRKMRLPGYDYAQSGAYFVTVCTVQRQCILSAIVDANVELTQAGSVVRACWNDLPNHYPHVELDAFVIMPNHVHGILRLIDLDTPDTRHALPEIVRAFKTFSSRRINEMLNQPGNRIWHHSFYDHIIRDEQDLNRIREYIQNNPLRWEDDPENPDGPDSRTG